MATKIKDSEEIAELKAELALLRRELEDERLRRESYQLIIKIAEKEFNIPIEKKFGVKRSKNEGPASTSAVRELVRAV